MTFLLPRLGAFALVRVLSSSASAVFTKAAICVSVINGERLNHTNEDTSLQNTSDAINSLRGFRVKQLDKSAVTASDRPTTGSNRSDEKTRDQIAARIRAIELDSTKTVVETETGKEVGSFVFGKVIRDKNRIQNFLKHYEADLARLTTDTREETSGIGTVIASVLMGSAVLSMIRDGNLSVERVLVAAGVATLGWLDRLSKRRAEASGLWWRLYEMSENVGKETINPEFWSFHSMDAEVADGVIEFFWNNPDLLAEIEQEIPNFRTSLLQYSHFVGQRPYSFQTLWMRFRTLNFRKLTRPIAIDHLYRVNPDTNEPELVLTLRFMNERPKPTGGNRTDKKSLWEVLQDFYKTKMAGARQGAPVPVEN